MSRHYDEEFRREAIKLVTTEGLSVNRAAADLGIGATTLTKWIAASDHARAGGLRESELEELKRLRKENLQLRMERDILKKATAYFAKTAL